MHQLHTIALRARLFEHTDQHAQPGRVDIFQPGAVYLQIRGSVFLKPLLELGGIIEIDVSK